MLAKLLALTILITGLASVAENKLDGDTDGLVIDRLERALEGLDQSDDSRTEVMIRLADLYAERARISEMNQIAKEVGTKSPVGNCDTCQEAKKDRKRAIELYTEVFEKGKSNDKGRILLQMAHLSQLNGDDKKAQMLFEKILSKQKNYGEDLVAESHAGLGEILYRKQDFKKARNHFEKAVINQNVQKRGQLIYRLAWCHLNLGNLNFAKQNLEKLLRNPELLSYRSGDQSKIDNSFHEEVSRDYATFIARSENVTESDINNVINLSPEASRTNNLYHLANELDRLGKKKASLMAWRVANSRQTDPNEKLEGYVKMAQVQYDLGNKPLAAEEISKAAQFWKDKGCKEDQNCEELQHKLRKLITDWDRASKKTPSADLLKAYASYLQIFTQDTEITYWAANLAKSLNKHQEAAELFRRSTLLAKKELESTEGAEERNKLSNIFEGSLLSEIESAELSKSNDLRLEAYRNYLKQNPKGQKAQEVRYQVVRVWYEKGDYKKAAEGFRELVNDFNFPHQLKPQAADLALDSLNILKDGEKIEKWALDFSNKVPSRKAEYIEISRKAALNKIAMSFSSKNANRDDLRAGLEKLNAIPMMGMKKSDKINYLKDKITIARRLKDIEQVRIAAVELKSLTPFRSPDNVFARQQLLWVAENALDFKSAYELAKVTEIPGRSAVEMQLQLGIYADLAGLDPVRHYDRYIRSTPNKSSARQVMASLIKRSKNPSATFRRFENELAGEPSLYAPLALEDYGRNGDLNLARRRLSRPDVKSTSEAFIVYRHAVLNDFNQTSKALMFHKLNKSSDRQLKKTLSERLKLIQSAEARAKNAIRSRDWTLQLVHLDFLASEYARLYREILSLPVPRGLNRQQKNQYQSLLKNQAEPYSIKAQQFEQKVTDLWNQGDMRDNLVRDFSRTKGPLRNIMSKEVQTLIRIAPAKFKSDLRQALNTRPEEVDDNQIKKALSDVKRDPFDASNLEHLKELEKRAGRHAMVAFLEAKVEQLKKGERQ